MTASTGDLARLNTDTPFVQAQAALARNRAEDARREYQAGKLALPALMEFEQEHSAALLDEWLLSDADRVPRVDHLDLSTVSDPAEALFDHRQRWLPVLVHLTLLRDR